ncbi:MAG: serine/threonine-protein phosphatase [Bacilli bacterium]|nr:serine/threonine-protein phosphatase [Bacilli bacterium]
MIKGRFGCKTDIGLVRASNEDKALSLIDADGNVLLVVCDGMGGYMKGDFASKIAQDILISGFNSKKKWLFPFQVSNWVSKIIKSINYSVYTEATDSDNFKGMGTTLVMAIFFKDNIYIANIGDSRCYMLQEDKVEQLTRDQTYVEYLLSHNKISADEKLTSKDRHALMNFIGKNKVVDYEYKVVKNERKTILLCSDGLYNNASDKQIFSALNSDERLDQKISTLIGIAKANGGTDNIAVSLWEPYKND